MKKKRILLLSLLLLIISSSSLMAQDLISLRDGKEVRAVVFKIDGDLISYRIYNDSTGTTFYLDSRFVEKIKYASGETRVFEIIEDPFIQGPAYNRTLSVNLFGIFAGSINVRYHKLQGSGRVGLFIEGGIGLSPEIIRYYNYTGENYSYLALYGLETMKSQFYLNPGLYFYAPELSVFRFGSGISLFYGLYKAEEFTTYSQQLGTMTHKAFFRPMWNNRLDINMSEKFSIYTEGELSVFKSTFEQSVLHFGFTISF